MKQKVKEKIEEETVKDLTVGEQCHHYWVIEVADGPESRGHCKYCGVTREFMNSFPDFNPLKRSGNPLSLPELPGVEVDKGSKS